MLEAQLADVTWMRPDPWLAGCLGMPVHRLEPAAALGPELAGRLGALPRPSFAYVKVPCTEVGAVAVFEDAGFHVVDTNVRLNRSGPYDDLRPAGERAVARFAVPGDAEAVLDVARTSFEFSRFHLDPLVPPDVAGAVKAAWAGSFFAGQRGDAMVVADVDGRPGAFLLLLDLGDRLVIDLVAVAPRARRRGLAGAMVAFALRHMGEPAALEVGTQVGNTPSLRFYESLGFRAAAADYVLHRHATVMPDEGGSPCAG